MMGRFAPFAYGRFGGAGMVVAGICGVLGLLIMIGLVILIVRALVWGPRYRHAGHGCCMHGGAQEHDDALEVLRHRFASGEINKEEYEEKQKILKG